MSTLNALSIVGSRETGQDVRTSNVSAVSALSNILKSSLGPQGLDKMLVDDIGEVTVTNDGATILKLLEVQHPAAKVMVDLADLQDKEIGDGTTSVVLIAAELMKKANALVKIGIHPTSIISGYKMAMKESVRYIKENLAIDVSTLSDDDIKNVARTTLSSKYIGSEQGAFSAMIVQAMKDVKSKSASGGDIYPVKSVNVCKTHGKSSNESILLDGYALSFSQRASQGMPTSVQKAKIALLDFNLKQHRMQLGVQVLVDNPEELEKIRTKEKDIAKSKIEKIIAAGANVVLTTQGIDDMAMKYFVDKSILAVRRVAIKDMKRIAKATGGKVCLTMTSIDEEEEHFDEAWLGMCDEVSEERIGDWDYILIKGTPNSKSKTIILRGANDLMLDEMERSVHDALCAVSRTLQSKQVAAGGGAVEVALSTHLEHFAKTKESANQLAISEFAAALTIIPKTLAANAALDVTDLVARLTAKHFESIKDTAAPKTYGLDLIKGEVRDNLRAGVLEPLVGKIKSIRFATEAAITILRIDDMIKLEPEKEER